MTRSMVLLMILLVGVVVTIRPQPSHAQTGLDVTDYRGTMIRMIAAIRDARSGAANDVDVFQAIQDSGDPLYIAPLIDLGFIARQLQNAQDAAVFATLNIIAEPEFGTDWQAWFEWASSNDIALPPDYSEFKGLFFSIFIDTEFARFFPPQAQTTAQVNMLEAVWGGVRVDGIPSLVNAPQVTPEAATEEGLALDQFCRAGDCSYPAQDELVFGVSINGDNRAYPLRLLNWHEMFNDVLGHTPLYDAPDGEMLCNFRAPTDFRAVSRQGDDWVQIEGVSAGCPESGWVAVDALQWDAGSWDAVRDLLPDGEPLADADAAPIGQVIGKPVMLAYCTLCGAGVLYDVTLPNVVIDGEDQSDVVLEFGSTGMLMRSNKLMYDRNTDTVWNALTGTPAFGALAGQDIRLDILPVVVTDWASWLAEHPDTSVLSLRTGFNRNYTNGAAYDDYFNNPEFIMFPVWQQDTSAQDNKDMVFALTIDGTPKAYPLAVLVNQPVVNDTLADENVVILSRETPERDFFEPGGAAVRAYAAGDRIFTEGENPGEVVDQDGVVWQVTEDALIAPNRRLLTRLGGHLAFWFGWYSFNPDTLVYE